MTFIRRQIAELHQDDAVRLYGAALALVNVLAYLHWSFATPGLGRVLDPQTTPVCWPFFPACGALRRLDPTHITALLIVLTAAGVWNASLFFDRRRTFAAYVMLCGLTLVKIGIVAQDFRLTLNHHYMSAWVAVAYLCLSDKRQALTWLIPVMYCWAGVLKLDPQANWLSGAALEGARPLGLPPALVPYACLYVVVLELILVWGLVVRSAWLRFGALAQLILFHVSSYWVVGIYYPALMFILLTIYPLAWILLARREDAPRARRARWATVALLVVFSGAQVLRFIYPGDAALTGEGRIFALNMFDAAVECRATATIYGTDVPAREVRLQPAFVNRRIHCDPLVYYELTRQYCLRAASGVDIDLSVDSRRVGDDRYRRIVWLPAACSSDPKYTMWQHNRWILR